MPAVIPAELWQESGRWDALRQGAAAHQGPQRPRLLLRADPRGGGHRPRAPRSPLVPRAADEPLPDPDEVPRRGAPALRPHARPRVHHEGRVLLPRRPRPTPSASTSVMYDAYTRIFERCGLDVPRRSRPTRGAIGGVADARVPGARRLGRGRDRVAATRCGYAANVEKAEVARAVAAVRRAGRRARACRDARGSGPIEEVSAFPRSCRPSASSRRWSTDVGRHGRGRARARRPRSCPRRSCRPRSAARRSRWPTRTPCERMTGAPVGFAGPVGLARARPRRSLAARRTRHGERRQPRRRARGGRRPGARLRGRALRRPAAGAAPATRCPRCERGTLRAATAASRSARCSTSARSTREAHEGARSSTPTVRSGPSRWAATASASRARWRRRSSRTTTTTASSGRCRSRRSRRTSCRSTSATPRCGRRPSACAQELETAGRRRAARRPRRAARRRSSRTPI